MNNMMTYSIGGILTSSLLIFCIFTFLPISEVNAEEEISVNVSSYQNSMIFELENESMSKIKTVRVWLSQNIDATFTTFKTELGWGGGAYSDGKMIIFTATNVLNQGESVKFGIITDEIVDGINWKVLDRNDQTIEQGKTGIQEISDTVSSFVEDESKDIEEVKQTAGQLYGTKKFIPEKIRVGSDVRFVGNGFNPNENFDLYLDSTILKSVRADKDGNFITTLSIPDTYDVGIAEFIIKDESQNLQTTNINIDEAKNRFLQTTKFEVGNIPAEVRYEDTLSISGNAFPGSAVIFQFEDMDRIIEKFRVVTTNSNGKWSFEEVINRDEVIGEKYLIIKNNNDKTTKSLNIKSDNLVEISTSAIRYNEGQTISISGQGEPKHETKIWIKSEEEKIVHYDVFESRANGIIEYDLLVDDTFEIGTYTVILKQENGADATTFGIGKYPSTKITALMEKTNFSLNSKAVLNIIGPASSKIQIKILDSNDSIKMTDSITTTSTGKMKYSVDLDGFSSGIYRAVISSTNIQDSVKFSVGLEPGSGEISLISIQENYSAGDSILVLGTTGPDARITVTLYEPSGKISSVTETFSDGSGNFSTDEVGIPINAELGVWKITAHSRLDTKSININVNLPASMGLTLDIEDKEFNPGNVVMITGLVKSDDNRLLVEIFNQDDEIIQQLETPVTGDGTFVLPWTVPTGIDTGIYTITVSDTQNSASAEIFIN